jgi:hypothetical protein
VGFQGTWSLASKVRFPPSSWRESSSPSLHHHGDSCEYHGESVWNNYMFNIFTGALLFALCKTWKLVVDLFCGRHLCLMALLSLIYEKWDKIGRVCSLQYTDIPEVFFTLQHGLWQSRATKGITNAIIVSLVSVAS